MRSAIILLFAISVLVSCGKAVVKDLPAGDKRQRAASLQSPERPVGPYTAAWHAFVLGGPIGTNRVADSAVFWRAMSNEAGRAIPEGKTDTGLPPKTGLQAVSNAALSYLALSSNLPADSPDAAFLFQRAGMAYFRAGEWGQARRWLNYALLQGGTNDPFALQELWYHIAILRAYESRNFKAAVEAIARVKPAADMYLTIDPQDLLMTRGFLEAGAGLADNAVASFAEAKLINPSRFYRLWDLAPTYIGLARPDLAKASVRDAFPYLTNGGPENVRDAWARLAWVNRQLKSETSVYEYRFPAIYPETESDPLVFSGVAWPIYRADTAEVGLPVQEKKWNKRDVTFSTFFEEFHEAPEGETAVLAMGMLDNSLLTNAYGGVVKLLSRWTVSNALVLRISPTNVYAPITNEALLSNRAAWQPWKDSNVIFQANLPIRTLLATDQTGLGGAKEWGYLFWGIGFTNEGVLCAYLPSEKSIRTVRFPLRDSLTRCIVQDLDGDGVKELLVLDREAKIYLLAGEKKRPQ